ncbi:nonstructural protein [Blackfly microvirus SF02]|uniref:Nonstructural protein n=1 Tax=Blackfly microvirus SF02 TaxID=2576452 RepID=A0A4P8PKU5_9VIRU|nr:nonstructural protein [Blackfly microvirus SF02]
MHRRQKGATTMPKMIIAIVDTLANEVTGPLWTWQNAAPAIRQFGDLVTDQKTQIAQHPEDYDLVQVGILEDDLTITPRKEVIITGRAIKAAQDEFNGRTKP